MTSTRITVAVMSLIGLLTGAVSVMVLLSYGLITPQGLTTLPTAQKVVSAAVVSQGDRISVPSDGNDGSYDSCTVAYVSHSDRSLWTAGHCGDVGDRVMLGARVIGTVTHSLDEYPGDYARVEVTRENTALGHNAYSGDHAVAFEDLTVGTTVCQFGSTTARPVCGEVTVVGNDVAVGQIDSFEVSGGDSGGPVWVPGRGLVGAISARICANEGVTVCESAGTTYSLLPAEAFAG